MEHATGSFGCQRPYDIDLQIWGTKGTVVTNNVENTARLCLRQTDRHKWMEFPAGRETKDRAAEFQTLINAIRSDAAIRERWSEWDPDGGAGLGGHRVGERGATGGPQKGLLILPRNHYQ